MLNDLHARKVVEAVRARLLELEKEPEAPIGDIEWLSARCDDTLGVYGGDDHWCNLSLRQLKKDVAQFNDEFADLLSGDLLMALENLPVHAS
ncbi:hypothetical protein A7982_13166 [Minicystis rosea]|nr:hypothetical protein A7982_13166 [Minicystis rosea]